MRRVTLFSAVVRRQTLQRPASLRTSHLRNRGFHATCRRSFGVENVSESILSFVHTYMQWEHATGLPWGVVIPLTALSIRLITAGPTLYARTLQQKYLDLQPLKQAWVHIIRKQVMKEHAERGPVWCHMEVTKRVAQQNLDFNKKWDISPIDILLVPAFSMVLFLIPIEAVRRMTGYDQGLFGIIGRQFTKMAEAATARKNKQSSEGAEQSPQNEGLQEAATAGQTHTIVQDAGPGTAVEFANPTGQGVQNESWLASLPDNSNTATEDSGLETIGEATSATSSNMIADTGTGVPLAPGQNFGLEPGFATEGILWVPDLLVPDPTLALPFMISAAMATNIYLGTRGTYDAARGSSKWSVRLKRIMYMMALAVPYVALKVPAAITLYWFSSASIAVVQNLVFDRWKPLRMPPTLLKAGVGHIGKAAMAQAQLTDAQVVNKADKAKK